MISLPHLENEKFESDEAFGPTWHLLSPGMKVLLNTVTESGSDLNQLAIDYREATTEDEFALADCLDHVAKWLAGR